MHPNPTYRHADSNRNTAFLRERGFGILSINGEDGPLAAHVPFILSDDGAYADFHLVRSNPITRALSHPLRALLAVSGPDGYVSPDWYGIDDQVPTWNYIAVHLRGHLVLRPADQLRDHLDELSAHFEARLLPKPAWLAAKMTQDALDRMMRQIVPVRLAIEDMQSTWKLSQNKPDAVRLLAADAMLGSPVGQETRKLAGFMEDPEI